MNVLMLNGSAKPKGCTYTALEEIGRTLAEEGVSYEIFQLGPAPIRDCIGCGQCTEHGCIFTDDAAGVASARRAGTTASLDALQKYFGISQMPTVGSTYWNMVHGNRPEEVVLDAEGLQTMRNIGHNLAWMLKCLQAGKEAGLPLPKTERGSRTNFIRP